MGKKHKNAKGKKVPLRFYIYAEDIVELKRKVEEVDFVEEFEDIKDSKNKHESYVINDYLALKLINGTTQIYIDGKPFIQCIRLIINIPYAEVENYKEIKSIDDAIDIYRKNMIRNAMIEGPGARHVQGFTPTINPKEEFRGHCSNIEAWAENDYNTCILHSNIAFPMLKKLAEVGDPKARRVFKEEIANRYEMGDESFRDRLKKLGYLKYLTKEELITVIDVAREKLNHSKNRYVKIREDPRSSNAIYNFVSYYSKSIDLFEAKKIREFLDSCKQTIIGLFQESIRIKSKLQSKEEIKNLILKRKLLNRELVDIKSKIHITGKLREFLTTLEVLIKHLDPNVIETQLDSFIIES